MKITLVRAKYSSVWEPQNLMHISAYLKANGFQDVTIVDGFFNNDSQILDQCIDADIVGISGTTPQLKHMKILGESIKNENPNCKIVFGGFAVSLEPWKATNLPYVDHIVLGEGEKSMLDIVSGVEQKKIVSNIPIQDIDSIPFADRDAIDLEPYIQIAKRDEGRRVTSVVTERGCAFGCTFCAEGEFGTIWRKYDTETLVKERAMRYRGRNPKLVVQEMIETRDRFNIEFFKTSDAETNPTRMHFLSLCKEMVERKLNVPWGCNIRVDKVDEEICQYAVKANCEEFWMGLESADEGILQHINKGITLDMIKRAFKVTKNYGITRRMYSFIGSPMETFATIKKTEDLVDEVEPDVFGVCVLCPYPGTIYWKKEFDDIDWSQVDEYANTFWKTENLTNEDLRNEQARLIKKYQNKLATNFNKKFKSGIIKPTGRLLDSLQQHPMRFQ